MFLENFFKRNPSVHFNLNIFFRTLACDARLIIIRMKLIINCSIKKCSVQIYFVECLSLKLSSNLFLKTFEHFYFGSGHKCTPGRKGGEGGKTGKFSLKKSKYNCKKSKLKPKYPTSGKNV